MTNGYEKRFETRNLLAFLENLDEHLARQELTRGEYIQIGILLKILEVVSEKGARFN
jgi:hypothetical protein